VERKNNCVTLANGSLLSIIGETIRGVIMNDKAASLRAPEASTTEDDVAVDSIALSRLIKEVRTEETMVSRHYNRQHNRHNR
jgi:hypothetical protein